MTDPDYALVAIRRYRTPDGAPTCETESERCEFLAAREEMVCEFFRVPVRLDETKPYLVPHGECPAWRNAR